MVDFASSSMIISDGGFGVVFVFLKFFNRGGSLMFYFPMVPDGGQWVSHHCTISANIINLQLLYKNMVEFSEVTYPMY